MHGVAQRKQSVMLSELAACGLAELPESHRSLHLAGRERRRISNCFFSLPCAPDCGFAALPNVTTNA